MKQVSKLAPAGLLLSAILAGCGESGPELASVDGSVTMDGQPLPNATVEFVPGNGRPSIGVTNEEGYYELSFSPTRDGAMIGKHLVRITTYRGDEDIASEESGITASPETVPARYNVYAQENPEMTVEVEPGHNTLDFKLSSEGDVVQPNQGVEIDGA